MNFFKFKKTQAEIDFQVKNYNTPKLSGSYKARVAILFKILYAMFFLGSFMAFIFHTISDTEKDPSTGGVLWIVIVFPFIFAVVYSAFVAPFVVLASSGRRIGMFILLLIECLFLFIHYSVIIDFFKNFSTYDLFNIVFFVLTILVFIEFLNYLHWAFVVTGRYKKELK
jgi:hypothetical protein